MVPDLHARAEKYKITRHEDRALAPGISPFSSPVAPYLGHPRPPLRETTPSYCSRIPPFFKNFFFFMVHQPTDKEQSAFE